MLRWGNASTATTKFRGQSSDRRVTACPILADVATTVGPATGGGRSTVAVSRYGAAAASLVAAGSHLAAVPGHLREWWGYGAFFILVALFQVAMAALLAGRPRHRVTLVAVRANTALLVLYAASRTIGVPLVGPHAGHPESVGNIDLIAAAAEALLVIALLMAPGWRRRWALAAPVVAAAGVAAAVLIALAAAGGAESEEAGSSLRLPGGVLTVGDVMPESMPSMQLQGFAQAGMNMSMPAMDMAPEGSRRFTLEVVLSATGGSGLHYDASDIRVSGPGIPKSTAVRQNLGSGLLPPGSSTAGSLVFDVPESATNLDVSMAGARGVLAVELPEGQDGNHGHEHTTAAGRVHAHGGGGEPAGFALLPISFNRDSWLAAALVSVVVALLTARRLPAPRATLNAIRPPRAIIAGGLIAISAVALLGSPAQRSPASANSLACGPGSSVDRTYDVVALSVPIPFNRWQDILQNGQVFALSDDKEAVQNWYVPLNDNPSADPAGNRRLRPRPLVLRANEGECVKVSFTNELSDNPQAGEGLPSSPRASIHVHGPAYDAQTSDGSKVGFNEDTTVPNRDDVVTPGQDNQIQYYWRVPGREGLYFFHDHGLPAGSEHDAGATGFGLFGALAVEPPGSQYRNPVSGDPFYTGPAANHFTGTGTLSGDVYVDAIIDPAAGQTFRESIQLSWDEIPSIGLGFNYGSEPGAKRIENRCPDCVGEETSLSSWAYGDPALIKLASGFGPWLPLTDGGDPEDCGLDACYVSNVFHAYEGDPTKIRFGHAGSKEMHVFHLHAHQWLAEPEDVGGNFDVNLDGNTPSSQSASTTIDSQTFGPGEMFTAVMLGGAGSLPGTIGDSIFHCHLYPHFAEGFWALFRVHDVLEDGTGTTPDGVRVRPVAPLSAAETPPAPSLGNPGFPRFIPGEFGWRPPQPPGGLSVPGTETDNPSTPHVREDLVDATRLVAGSQLDPEKVALESAVSALNYAGQEFKRGAPLKDPCPAGSREVTYNASVLQVDLKYNEAGWHDTQGRILVPEADVPAILAGKQPEPLFIRVNAGDCINFNLTNRLPNFAGGDAFVQLTQTNMAGEHIHLVKFDVLGSDGSTNGWNYNQAAYSEEQAAFDDRVLAGSLAPGETCEPTTDTPTLKAAGCRIQMEAAQPWDPGANVDGNPGQTIHERWYADYELRTVFTHDHHFPAIDQNRGLFGALIVEPAGFDFRDRNGDFHQPINDSAHGTVCAAPAGCEATASGAVMDVLGPAPDDDFREFGLAFQDFVTLTRAGGDPANPDDVFNPPAVPEEYPDADPGVMGINYKNAPFVLRATKNGSPVDPAYVFSSELFGDPQTPVLTAYARDRVRLRLIQGSQEEQHAFTLHGFRWRQEPNDPLSPLVNSQALGVSEAFNFELPDMYCDTDDACLGDHLYSSTATDDLWLGMWGIFRVYGKGVSGLLPLPDNIPPAGTGSASLTPSGQAPPPANKPGTICPAGAPLRRYDVVAMELPLVYNEYGDHDPYGLVYAMAEDRESLLAGTKEPEPLVLRANEGDCIEVTLENAIDPNGPFATRHRAFGVADGDPSLPLEPPSGTAAGLRVSLHPQLVRYDVRGSDGATVGFNRDQTVGPGQSILYRWYADDVTPGELGSANMLDFGDVRGHRHHGLFAGLIIEPRDATYHDPATGSQIQSGAAADIRLGAGASFREFTVFFQDGLNLRDPETGLTIGEPSHPPAQGDLPEPLDAEDQGRKGFNYRSASFDRRLGYEPTEGLPILPASSWAHVFSSVDDGHGDPLTPIFRAYEGDNIRFRVLQGSDKPRQHAFQLAGASWLREPDNPESNLVSVQGGITVGRAVNVEPGQAGSPGDYRYACQVLFHHLSGGLWGMLRVYPQPDPAVALAPTAIGPIDDPRAGGHPIMPIDIVEIEVKVFDDSNMNGSPGGGEAAAAGQTVDLRAPSAEGNGAVLASAVTDNAGLALFLVPQGSYDVTLSPASGWASTTATRYRVDTAGGAASAGPFGVVRLGSVSAAVFDDRNGDGARQPATEAGLAAWLVTLQGGGQTWKVSTDGGGVATFPGLKPGTYTASAAAAPGWSPTVVLPVSAILDEGGSVTASLGYSLPAGFSVRLYNDSDGDGEQDPGESSLSGRSVSATRAGGGTSLSGTTDASGTVNWGSVTPGTYTVTQVLQPDWYCGTVTTMATDAAGTVTNFVPCAGASHSTVVLEGTAHTLYLGDRNPNAWLVAIPFVDTNMNGTRQDSEAKLIGWTASLYNSTGTLLATALTGPGGRATFYPRPPGTYVLKMTPPPPQPGSATWTRTSPESVTLSAIAGEAPAAMFGFVQLGSITAVAYEDLNKDGQWNLETEAPLSGRNVRVYDKTGKILLGQGVTDANGRFAFSAVAKKEYNLEVLLPKGWRATSPLSTSGKPVTKVKVVGPASNASIEVYFGQGR